MDIGHSASKITVQKQCIPRAINDFRYLAGQRLPWRSTSGRRISDIVLPPAVAIQKRLQYKRGRDAIYLFLISLDPLTVGV